MKVKEYRFTGSLIEEQIIGGPDEMLSAILNLSEKYKGGYVLRNPLIFMVY